ncbi:MAG: HD domain-containing phosphohydrolase [Planctomycetota bacterium]
MLADPCEARVDWVAQVLGCRYAVEPAVDYAQAVARAMSGAARAIVLGEKPGCEAAGLACAQIQQNDRHGACPVMLVIDHATAQDRLRGYGHGADDVISAPFDPEDFLARVDAQLRLAQANDELDRIRSAASSDNQALSRQVDEAQQQVHDTRDLLVFALARLAESRDPETGAHLERMRAYCRVIAGELSRKGAYAGQIDPAFIDDLYRASPLHDIGKVGIPDAILLKPARLSPAEFSVMQTHCAIGADALQEVAQRGHAGDFLRMAVEIARHHHERWDGAGYPDGLVGEAIPLAARIVSVADVFDALTTARIYKPAYPEPQARRMILDGAGAQFDPVVVEAFEAVYDQVAATLERLGAREVVHDAA